MMHLLKRTWDEIVAPILLRPKQLQVAALCYKETAGSKKVLLITSRDTGRWIIPKGWPMDDKTDAEAALQEAWEEAGVSAAEIEPEPLGSYSYDKGLNDGSSVPIETQVYLARVKTLKNNYPEVDQRDRTWVTPQEAAKRVDEPELKALLQTL